MNSTLPCVSESPHLLGLTSSIFHLSVLDIPLSSAYLPVRPELNPIGRVEIDHLNLTLEPLLFGKASHNLERVPQNHAVRPFLIVLVELNLAVELQCVKVVEEARQEA